MEAKKDQKVKITGLTVSGRSHFNGCSGIVREEADYFSERDFCVVEITSGTPEQKGKRIKFPEGSLTPDMTP